MTKGKVINIGIMSPQDYRQRSLAIARGLYIPEKNAPKIWFASLAAVEKVFTAENKQLLQIIVDKKPASIKELAMISKVEKTQLLSMLHLLKNYRIIKLVKQEGKYKPVVRATQFRVSFSLID